MTLAPNAQLGVSNVSRGTPRPADRLRGAKTHAHGGAVYEAAKRGIDVTLSLAALVVAAPLVMLVAVWTQVVDPGPVFYRQARVGRDGWLFWIWKLRTMSLKAEAGGARFAELDDPRVLPGMRWVRKSHIDELPQLINILRGEMSLVGPRPERPELHEAMRGTFPGIERRLAVAPGLTGLAQVVNGYTNDLAGMRRKLALDLQYVRRRGLRTDLVLLVATLPKLWDRGAC
ncbi:MAG: sugar transferase [Planctomycetota bacterium]